MSITLNAQPYDMTAGGFYFRSTVEFVKHFQTNRNDQGDPVEEYEIQFIDGDDLDCALAKAIGLNQSNFADFLELTEAWEDWEKIHTIIAVHECGYDFDPQNDPDHYGIEIYAVESLRELAEQFVDDGLYGEIPESLQFYIDYDAVARDLAMEYSETTIAGETYVYRCS